MPKQRPTERKLGMVAFLGCSRQGLLPIKDVEAAVAADAPGHPSEKRSAEAVADLVSKSDFVVKDERCPVGAALAGFSATPRWGDLSLWVRNR